jgi:ABC-type multidrug transport system ATPase subunit
LLNILAARCPDGSKKMSSLSGVVTVNGEERNDLFFRRISAYVLQDDHLYPHLTVLETFTLAAAFYLPYDSDHAGIVDAVIHELGLVKCRDTIIGDDKLRGVSGGERKRANIGIQLISDPAVLFLDEPTSGLDSFQALSVMEAMKQMSRTGRLVITVIHQPRSSIFYMFDKLMLLSEGKTMYYGPSSEATEHFSKSGFPCPELFNPADFYLDILSPDVRNPELEKQSFGRIDLLADAWKNDAAAEVSTEAYKGKRGLSIRGIGTEGFDIKKEAYVTSLLFWRTWAEQSRDTTTLAIKFTLTVFFALVIGGLFSNIGYDQRSIQNRSGLFFFIMINQCFNTLVSVVNVFPKEKTIVNRERSNNAYSTFTYFASKVLVEIPLIVAPSLLYSLIIYWMVELNPHHFIEFALILMLLNVTAAALGLAVSAAAPSVEAANAMSTPFMIIGILFGGFYINVKSLPIVANWIPYMSLFRWGFQALLINEYTGLQHEFECPDNASCLNTGEDVLRSLSFASHTVRYPVFGLGMVLLGFLFMGYLVLYMVRLQFISLGHEGALFAKKGNKATASSVHKKSVPLSAGGNAYDHEIELVPAGQNGVTAGSSHGYSVVQTNDSDAQVA